MQTLLRPGGAFYFSGEHYAFTGDVSLIMISGGAVAVP
jgi:hypothetical protein